ncbi:DUF3429 domain-containing protein [Nguyenibacter vanlangensis]|uniref:DUF3429 domain-containing protein n=1 Tax=Nguyenibacter vanlangensis TaxID=1216886 RepID=A0ABZ3D7A8_9PROT
MKRLPLLAIILAIASPAPALLFGAGVIFFPAGQPAPGAGTGAASGPMMALAAYCGLLLAFGGAVHWGLALDRPVLLAASGTASADTRRLLTGAIPLPVAWLGIQILYMGHAVAGLIILMAGFGGLFAAERAAWRRGELPSGYLALRLWITAVTLSCLALIVLTRLA